MSRIGEQWRSAILGGTPQGNGLFGRVRVEKARAAKIPALDAMTQGTWKDDSCAMIRDMPETLVNLGGFSVCVKRGEDCGLEITSKSSRHWDRSTRPGAHPCEREPNHQLIRRVDYSSPAHWSRSRVHPMRQGCRI